MSRGGKLVCMHWMMAHVYVVLLGLVAFTIITGGIVISNEGVNTTGTVNTWNRTGGFAFLGNERSTQHAYTLSRPSTPNVVGAAGEYTTIQISDPTETQSMAQTLPDEWQSLLKQLTQSNTGTVTAEAAGGTDAYAFIPQGLISVPNLVNERTAEQEALYTYGNRVGSLIRAFDESHSDMIAVLKDAYADRGNPAKREAAERIGVDYEMLGKELVALTDIPSSVQRTHAAIAQSYQDAGRKMVAKLRTQTDEEFLAAMHAYNASALQFTNNFVALATYLSASGVKFSSSDSGSVFTFTSF